MVAPISSSPGPLVTGMASPVIIDSSKADRPAAMMPSTGTFSPGRTTIRSPTTTWRTSTCVSAPSRTTQAVLAPRAIRAFSAAEARPLARSSRYLPRLMRVMIPAPVS